MIRGEDVLLGHYTALLTGALDLLSLAAFICNRNARVCSMSAAGEHLLAAHRGLEIHGAQLSSPNRKESGLLCSAILSASSPLQSDIGLRTLLFKPAAPHGAPLILDITALPFRSFESIAAPSVIVVARGSRHSAGQKVSLLRLAYGLTTAEANIGLLLAEGRAAESIASQRNVRIATVRSQIKTIFSKLGVSRQAALVAILRDF